MTWTYSGDTSTSDLDFVRFLIGDTNPQNQMVRDQEILGMLGKFSSIYYDAAAICRAIAGQYAALPDCKVGDLSKNSSQISKNLLEKAKEIESMAKRNDILGASMFVGGISKAEKQNLDSDQDAVCPNFVIEQFDYPGVSEKSKSEDCC